MTAKTFRNLIIFCCTASAVLLGMGIASYVGQKQWVEQVNTPENVALLGAVEFRPPVFVSNALYVAGLFLALGGCLALKADASERETQGRAVPESDEASD